MSTTPKENRLKMSKHFASNLLQDEQAPMDSRMLLSSERNLKDLQDFLSYLSLLDREEVLGLLLKHINVQYPTDLQSGRESYLKIEKRYKAFLRHPVTKEIAKEWLLSFKEGKVFDAKAASNTLLSRLKKKAQNFKREAAASRKVHRAALNLISSGIPIPEIIAILLHIAEEQKEKK